MTARTASSKVGDRPHAWMLAVMTAMAILAGCGFTDTEHKYLDALHHPCQHPEFFSNVNDKRTAYCDFVWSGNDKAQVAEGHEICDVEKKAPPGEVYDAPADLVKSRHPDYRAEQINTELIAAEQTLCRERAP